MAAEANVLLFWNLEIMQSITMTVPARLKGTGNILEVDTAIVVLVVLVLLVLLGVMFMLAHAVPFEV